MTEPRWPIYPTTLSKDSKGRPRFDPQDKVIRRFFPTVAAQKLSNLYSPADTARFAPVSDAAKAELRRDLFPAWMPQNSFVLGWIGRNQWRKQVWLLYKTISYLRKGHYHLCRQCSRVSPLDWEPSMAGARFERPLASEQRPGQQPNVCSHCGSDRIERAKPLRDVFLWCHMTEEPEQDWRGAQSSSSAGVAERRLTGQTGRGVQPSLRDQKSFLRFERQSWKEPLGIAFTALRCQATLANRRTPSPSARARVTHKATPEATNLSR